MNKKFKKSVAFLAAASMVSAAVPMIASADDNGIVVNGTTASVTTDKAAVAVVASYDTDGRLTAVASTNVSAGTTDVAVAEGDKVMLWNGLGSEANEPVVNAVAVEAAEETTAPTATTEATAEPTATPDTDATAKPTLAPVEDAINTWLFDFGSAEDVAEGYTAVPADKVYSNADGYGFLGLEDGFALDSREDGWVMTQGYDLVLENGTKSETVESADDDFVATTTRTEKDQAYNSPIRFSMRVDGNTYYRVRVHLTRADASKEAKVSLFTEKRHQHLLDEPIPAEGLDYETNVYVHNNWSKNTYEYSDKQLSIAAAGDNVAVSSVEIYQLEQGKTFWILGDSTVCQQTAAIPYWPLDHCQGVGSGMTKYISADWALVNEAESGLSASSSRNHFNNMVNDIKPGDMVWFEFGHNDDKVTNDPSTNGYLSTLENFYNTITEKGASLIVASPIQRCTAGQFSDGKWSASLAQYGTAAAKFVDDQIVAGKDNIAFIDLNALSLDFLNEVQSDIDASREASGLASLGSVTPRFYYYVSKYAGYSADYTHPNDFGADNFAKISVDNAKSRIAAAGEAALSDNDSESVQVAVLSQIFGDTRDHAPVRVAAEVADAGAAPNSFYPSQLAKVILYDYPIIVNSVSFTEANKPEKINVKLVPSNLTFAYGRAIVDIYDNSGALKGTVKSVDVIDAVAAETQEVAFEDTDVVFDAAAGDTFKAYIKAVDGDTFELLDTVVSTVYTQNDMIDVKEYLLQGNKGTENKEDFSSYDLAVDDSIIGKNGWTNPGGETFAYGEENGLTFAHCVTTGAATYYPEKKFTAVKDGQLYCRMDVRYISGEFNLYFTDGGALNNWPDGRIMPVSIKTDGGEVKVYLNGTAAATINSGEWVTLALTIDLDYGTYTLSLNGQTYTSDFPMYQSSQPVLVPGNLSLIAFQNGKSSNEYDVTNIVLATLNTPELPDRTIHVDTEDEAKGTVSIKGIEGTETSVKMNTVVTAVAEPAEGYSFKDWVDENGTVVSYAVEYEVRVHSNTALKAEFDVAEYDPISYAYKEQFSTLSTSTLASNGWTSPNAQGNATVESDTDHGNYLQFAPGQANDRNLKGTFPAAAQLSEDYVVEFDLSIKPGNNHATDFVVYDSSASISANSQVADNYILKLYNGAANSVDWTVNGSEDVVKIPSGTWVHVSMTVHPSASNVDIAITNGSAELFNKTEAVSGTGILGGMNILSGRYQGVTCVDNIKVYTADQIVE